MPKPKKSRQLIMYTICKASLHKHSFRNTYKKRVLVIQGLVRFSNLSFIHDFIHRWYSSFSKKINLKIFA